MLLINMIRHRSLPPRSRHPKIPITPFNTASKPPYPPNTHPTIFSPPAKSTKATTPMLLPIPPVHCSSPLPSPPYHPSTSSKTALSPTGTKSQIIHLIWPPGLKTLTLTSRHPNTAARWVNIHTTALPFGDPNNAFPSSLRKSNVSRRDHGTLMVPRRARKISSRSGLVTGLRMSSAAK